MEGLAPPTILVHVVAPSGPTHEFLLLRQLPARGGFWQGISGAAKPGEAFDDAAVRELHEKTALVPSHLLPVGRHHTFPMKRRPTDRSSPAERITEHVFLALLNARVDPTIDPNTHDAWDWYTYEDALRWLEWPENMEALRRCEALITDRPQPAARNPG